MAVTGGRAGAGPQSSMNDPHVTLASTTVIATMHRRENSSKMRDDSRAPALPPGVAAFRCAAVTGDTNRRSGPPGC